MKKVIFSLMTLAAVCTGCGGSSALSSLAGLGSSSSSSSSSASSGASSGILSSVLGAATNTGTVTNILGSVLGINKVSQANLVGTWKYVAPGCAFTSENLLAKAGGEVAATTVKQKLTSYYNSVGINSSNTYFTFNSDNSFSAKVGGKSISGTYTYDASAGEIKLKILLVSLKGYVTANSNGMGLLFESKKLLSLLQTIASLSGNSSIEAIGSLSKNYDGVRMGFDLSK